ncbi:hypothetical protein Pint_10858 [Pistacia integerrima]|uniref:Uncharacterized protein n=1 Tax=Pistacia integerrima TaxID=434235 RepID=A0ACC0XKN1_9ROSI|nr:hypothetical protein Pint_10858 [Pistacia integerrima]
MKEVQQGNQAKTQQDIVTRLQSWEIKTARDDSSLSCNCYLRRLRAGGIQRRKAQDQNNLSRRPRKQLMVKKEGHQKVAHSE